MRFVALLPLASFVLCSLVSASDVLVLGKDADVLDQSPEFQLFGKRVPLDDLEYDTGHDGEIVAGLTAMQPGYYKFPFVVRRATGLRNGFAVIRKGERYIVYDPTWYGLVHYYAGRALVLGHEIGHHMCGHTIGMMRDSPWEKELEADRYLGAAVRKINGELGHSAYSIDEIVAEARYQYSAAGSQSHPDRESRVAAILDGYRNGSPCMQRGVMTPEPLTEEDDREAEVQYQDTCKNWIKEFCATRDLANKRVQYETLSIAGCMQKPQAKVSQYTDGGRKYLVFANIDCATFRARAGKHERIRE